MAKSAKLASGFACPLLGYGTFQSKDAALLKTALIAAVKAGYRHIDTAFAYENEHVIGETLDELYKENVVKREDIFITTKLFSTFHRRELVPQSLKKQLERLRTNYVDLYLIHFPVALKQVEGQFLPFGPDGKLIVDAETRIEDTWRGLEDCVKAGLARSIGVSNFNISQIERLQRIATVPVSMNQVESHPGFQNTKLIDYCQAHNVAVTAYSQFGSPGTRTTATGEIFCNLNLLEDERIINIGKKYGKNTAQVILRWQIQRNVFVIPKSTTPARIVDNANLWDFELSDEDMKTMASIDLNSRYSWLALPGIKDHPDYPHTEAASC